MSPPSPDDWGVVYPDDWPVPSGARLIIAGPGGELLATITPREGRSAAQALDDLAALGDLLALLPPGAHPLPVN